MTTTTPTTPTEKNPTTCGRCQRAGAKEPRFLMCPACTPARRAEEAAQKEELIRRYLTGEVTPDVLGCTLYVHHVVEQALDGAQSTADLTTFSTYINAQIAAYLDHHPWPLFTPATPVPGLMTRGRRLLALARTRARAAHPKKTGFHARGDGAQ